MSCVIAIVLRYYLNRLNVLPLTTTITSLFRQLTLFAPFSLSLTFIVFDAKNRSRTVRAARGRKWRGSYGSIFRTKYYFSLGITAVIGFMKMIENDTSGNFLKFFPWLLPSPTKPRQIFPTVALRVIFECQILRQILYVNLTYRLSSLDLGT